MCPKHGGGLPNVKAKAAERLADLIDPDRWLREVARLAYSDLRLLFDEQGNLKPVKDWPAEGAAAVAGVEILKRNLIAGDGQMDSVHKLKTWDKTRALEQLGKHLGMLTEKVQHSGEMTIVVKGME